MARPIRYFRHVALGFLGLVSVAVTASAGCRSATQVTVELRTLGMTCADVKGVGIVVAGSASDAEDRLRLDNLSASLSSGECGADPSLLGTLVVTPSGGSGAIVIRARVGNAAGDTCTAPDYKGCIVARRAFGFVDHAGVTLPITLELSCKDVPCDAFTSCKSGTCISSTAQCSENAEECSSEAEPMPGPDGSAPPGPDGGADGTAATDAAQPDGSAPDGSTDDGATDAPFDVNPDQFGNACPTAMGPVDCMPHAQLCCFKNNLFTCSTGCPAGADSFNCLGRKYCAGFCCGAPPSDPMTFCDTTAGQACSQNGNHYICTTDADCPMGHPTCTGSYYPPGQDRVKECQ